MNHLTPTTTTLPTAARRAGWSFSPAMLAGGGLLVAALGAGAGWMLRGGAPSPTDAPSPVALATQPVAAPMRDTLAPPDEAASLARPAPVYSPSAPQAHAVPAPQPRELPAPERHAAAPVERAAPAPARSEPRPAPVAPVCRSCGVVESVQAVQRQGQANGIGAVAGGVIGGALGNRVGGGNGRTAMTVLGALGGGYAGHEIEKRARAETVYDVRVRMDDGSSRHFTRQTPVAAGARVVVEGSTLRVQ